MNFSDLLLTPLFFLFRSYEKLTTYQILEELEKLADNDAVGTIDVYIEPPEDAGNETECDSGDEDCNDPDRLSRRQLNAGAQIVINHSEEETVNLLSDEVSAPVSNNVEVRASSLSNVSTTKPPRKKSRVNNRGSDPVKWVRSNESMLFCQTGETSSKACSFTDWRK